MLRIRMVAPKTRQLCLSLTLCPLQLESHGWGVQWCEGHKGPQLSLVLRVPALLSPTPSEGSSSCPAWLFLGSDLPDSCHPQRRGHGTHAKRLESRRDTQGRFTAVRGVCATAKRGGFSLPAAWMAQKWWHKSLITRLGPAACPGSPGLGVSRMHQVNSSSSSSIWIP